MCIIAYTYSNIYIIMIHLLHIYVHLKIPEIFQSVSIVKIMLYFVKFMPLDTAVISGVFDYYSKLLFRFCLAFSLRLRFHCPGRCRVPRTYSGLVEKRSQADSSPTQVLSYIVIVSVLLF